MNHSGLEMVAHYYKERPHLAKENELLIQPPAESSKKKMKGRKASPPPQDVVSLSNIKCRQRLGGLLKHYSRKAA